MGWKAVKDHYRIEHIVQVTDKGICIGSPYIHDILVISKDGVLMKPDRVSQNVSLRRYQDEMEADPALLQELVLREDVFDRSIKVYTYDGAEIIEKLCEEPDWPNVTHDGLVMYENTFSTDREKVVKFAWRNASAGVEAGRRYVKQTEEELASRRQYLAQAEADLARLGNEYPDLCVAD